MDKTYITASQIRAARGLLNWSQDDLASASSLSIATIRKLESGKISPRDKTTGAIASALECAKVEFLSSGVRLKENDLVVLEGDDSYLQLMDDVYLTMKGKNGEILFMNGDCAAANEEEIQAEVRTRKDGNRWRLLTEEGNTHLYFPLDEFRWIPKKFFRRNIQVVYGNKVAMGVEMDLERNQTTKMIIVESKALAQATKNLFDFMWESCRKPPYTTASKVYE